MSKNTAEYWYRLAVKIDRDIETALQSESITLVQYADAIKAMMYSLTRKNVFVNPYWNKPLEDAIGGLFDMVSLYFHNNTNAVVMIPMALDLIVTGNQPHTYMTDFLADVITIGMPDKKRVSKKMEPETPADPQEEAGRQMGHINYLIDEINNYARQEDYLNALRTINEVVPQIESFSQREIVIIDLPAILNNKAYFTLKIGKPETALEVVQDLIQKKPDYALAYHTQAEIFDEMQRYREAVISIDKAISLEESADKIEYKNQLLAKIGG
ncbi:MAG: hypothetical protein MUC49_01420 [Raineya sp.]|jgi:tetratricopeptide (TPR) repeat protein|nr:hypothetical protein [Raineya sp.]